MVATTIPMTETVAFIIKEDKGEYIMTSERQAWYDKHKKYFKPSDLSNISLTLNNVDDYTFALIQTTDFKNPKISTLLSVFLGWFGIDAFFEGNYLKGFIKLITSGGFGILNIIDIFTIKSRTIKNNVEKWNVAIGVAQNVPQSDSQIDMEKVKNFVKSDEFKTLKKQFSSLKDCGKALSDNQQAYIR